MEDKDQQAAVGMPDLAKQATMSRSDQSDKDWQTLKDKVAKIEALFAKLTVAQEVPAEMATAPLERTCSHTPRPDLSDTDGERYSPNATRG
jgi:hypothetical protein